MRCCCFSCYDCFLLLFDTWCLSCYDYLLLVFKTTIYLNKQNTTHAHTHIRPTAIEKSKKEDHPDLAQLQQDRAREIQMEKKQEYKRIAKEKAEEKKRMLEEKEAKSYDRIFKEENMVTNAAREATEDATAAEEYEVSN